MGLSKLIVSARELLRYKSEALVWQLTKLVFSTVLRELS